MNQTQRLEQVVPRLTAEQLARLVSFAESLVTESLPPRLGRSQIFPADSRRRLRELTAKSEAETLSEIERAEYVTLAQQRENADAARLTEAAQLSKQKGIGLSEALAQCDAGANGRG